MTTVPDQSPAQPYGQPPTVIINNSNSVVASAAAACTVKNLEIKNNHAPWQNVAPEQKKNRKEEGRRRGEGRYVRQTLPDWNLR